MFEAREQKRLQRENDASHFREAERKRLWQLWEQATPAGGTKVDEYLRGRGLQLPQECPGLRYLPFAIYYHGETVDSRGHAAPAMRHTGPAMLAAFIRVDGKFGGLHMTWLSAQEPPGKL